MVDWGQFTKEAPQIAEVFLRRHSKTGNLCLLATLRADGSPRISPMEPGIFEGRLVLLGMPYTSKFRDLERDPRFELHTATIDPYVGDRDAKVWGEATNLQDAELHARFAQNLFEHSGMDLRGQKFDPSFVGDLAGASSVEFRVGQLTITTWKPRQGERSAPLG
jgi:Pyridoxamine 5'-phosphate oxidase